MKWLIGGMLLGAAIVVEVCLLVEEAHDTRCQQHGLNRVDIGAAFVCADKEGRLYRP